jgi:APA family basic amino acid/polyamine antiporter
LNLFRTKSVEQSIADTEEPEHQLKKQLSAFDLIIFGIGVIIGTGIFVLTGVAARDSAGPGVALSFVIAGLVCGLAALCYAELASTVPVAGSAYTFTFATMGELIAWIIGWDLVLEFSLAAAVVAVGWSQYFVSLLDSVGITVPTAIAGGEESTINLPGMVIVALLTVVAVLGIKLSSRFTAIMVALKVTIVLAVIVVGAFFIKAANYTPFIPPAEPAEGASGLQAPLLQSVFSLDPVNFGIGGLFAAAALVFFAYIGFDIVATTAEETRNPQRDMPRGILGALAICTVLYVLVCLVVTGMQNYAELNPDAPLAEAFKSVGLPVFASIISLGAVAGLTSVMLILMLGQSRVLFAMSRDRLLPVGLAKVHPTWGTPYRITIGVGVVVTVLAGFIPLEALAELVNIGTLFAFLLVSIGVVILRRTRPDLPRSFRVPFSPVLPAIAVLACLFLMLNLTGETWLRFLVWMVAGFVVYFFYSARHSRLATGGDQSPESESAPSRTE